MAPRPATFALFALVCALACSASLASADDLWASDAAGAAKGSFYDNQTVYVSSINITAAAQAVRVYIVLDSNSWTNGTTLADVTGAYRTLTTNASGHLAPTSIWATPAIGAYDVVVDMNNDNKFNFSVDYIDTAVATGFSVTASPKPTLAVAAGSHNPAARNWPLDDHGHATMLHFNLTTGAAQGVSLQSLAISASGTGNDLADINVVYFVEDPGNDGTYGSGDSIVGYGIYTRDDGVITFDIAGGYELQPAESRAFVIAYDMKAGSSGSTYAVDVTAITANGTATYEPATVSGLVLKSATMTLGEPLPSTTTTIESTTTTTIAASGDQCQTDADCPVVSCSDLKKSTYSCTPSATTGLRVCAATIESVECCGDGDCVEGYACAGYACVTIGFHPVWLGGEIDYLLLGGSVVVVVGAALAVFVFLKNRRRTPWKGKRDYEREWRGLKEKWKK